MAHTDGFSLLTNEELPSVAPNPPPSETLVLVLYQYSNSGKRKWKAWLGGSGGHASESLPASVDINGDLVYSEKAGYYGYYTRICDKEPYANIYAGDQDVILVNTKTQGMLTEDVKVSNENTTNRASGESMNGMFESYSGSARSADSKRYAFS